MENAIAVLVLVIVMTGVSLGASPVFFAPFA